MRLPCTLFVRHSAQDDSFGDEAISKLEILSLVFVATLLATFGASWLARKHADRAEE
jgi:hypothetical protein